LSNLLPGGQGLEVAECLSQLQWLIHNPFALLIVTDFGIAGEREIFSEWMTFETIVCQYSSEIRMSIEENAIKIPGFPFVPVCTSENASCTWNGVCLTSLSLDPNSSLVFDAEKVVNDFKTLFTFWKVYTTDVHDAFELTLRMVSQKCQKGNDGSGCNVKSELVFEDGELLNEFWKTLG